MRIWLASLVVIGTACSTGGGNLEGLTVEDGRRQLKAHLQDAIAYVPEQVESPFETDDTPAPCFDDHTKAPDMGVARVDYVVEVEFGKSYESAEKVRQGLERDGWTISTNTGAPEEMLMFSADKDDYSLLVSGSKGKDVGSLLIGGSSPCLPKETES